MTVTNLAEGVGQVLLSPDDMADVHQAIINGHTEVVDRQAIAAQHHKVSQAVGVPADLSSDGVLDGHSLIGGHSEAVAVRLALCQHLVHFCLVSATPLAPEPAAWYKHSTSVIL